MDYAFLKLNFYWKTWYAVHLIYIKWLLNVFICRVKLCMSSKHSLVIWMLIRSLKSNKQLRVVYKSFIVHQNFSSFWISAEVAQPRWLSMWIVHLDCRESAFETSCDRHSSEIIQWQIHESKWVLEVASIFKDKIEEKTHSPHDMGILQIYVKSIPSDKQLR